MNRTEYLRIRFKQDLLKFVLLPESPAAADETADSLVGDMDISAFVEDQSRKIDAICARELSLDSLKVGGELPDDLPEGFGLELGDRMTAEYRTSLDEELACLRKEAVDRLLLGIESQCWRNGLSVMPGVMRLLGERLETLAVNYGDLCQSPVPDAELRDLAFGAFDLLFRLADRAIGLGDLLIQIDGNVAEYGDHGENHNNFQHSRKPDTE